MSIQLAALDWVRSLANQNLLVLLDTGNLTEKTVKTEPLLSHSLYIYIPFNIHNARTSLYLSQPSCELRRLVNFYTKNLEFFLVCFSVFSPSSALHVQSNFVFFWQHLHFLGSISHNTWTLKSVWSNGEALHHWIQSQQAVFLLRSLQEPHCLAGRLSL